VDGFRRLTITSELGMRPKQPIATNPHITLDRPHHFGYCLSKHHADWWNIMKIRAYILGIAAASVMTAASLFAAESFDLVFRILRFTGDCQVTPPDATVSSAAKAGRAYPHGSTVRTGPKSTATIALSANNECSMKEQTAIYLVDPDKSRDLRTIQLLTGQVQVDLDVNAEPQKMPNKVVVKTVSAAASTRASRFSAISHPTNDLTVTTFTCDAIGKEGGKEGMLSITGPQFEIPTMKPTDAVEVSGTQDQSYTRLAVLRGAIPVNMRGPDGAPFTYEAKQRAVIKFWVKRADSGKAVSVAVRVLTSNGDTERRQLEDGTTQEMSYHYRLAEANETN
jgi:hypothetical protein